MSEEVQADPEQQTNEITADVVPDSTDQLEGTPEGETVEEFDDIVLAGQDEPQEPQDPKNKTDHILNRVIGRKNKLQDENVRLKKQVQELSHSRSQTPQAPTAPTLQAEPDEFSFEDRNQYLQAKAQWQSNMMSNIISNQLNQQQNGHRVAVQEQERTSALQTYAENAAKLKVKDFNEAQDNAFDVLGDEFAQLIAHQLPDKAPKLMYWLGKNPREAARYRDEYQTNPGRATFSLGELAGKLTIQSKRSNAAQPESKIENASVGGTGNSDWQKKYDKLMNDVTPNDISKTLRQVRALKSEAKKAGYDVSTLK